MNPGDETTVFGFHWASSFVGRSVRRVWAYTSFVSRHWSNATNKSAFSFYYRCVSSSFAIQTRSLLNSLPPHLISSIDCCCTVDPFHCPASFLHFHVYIRVSCFPVRLEFDQVVQFPTHDRRRYPAARRISPETPICGVVPERNIFFSSSFSLFHSLMMDALCYARSWEKKKIFRPLSKEMKETVSAGSPSSSCPDTQREGTTRRGCIPAIKTLSKKRRC